MPVFDSFSPAGKFAEDDPFPGPVSAWSNPGHRTGVTSAPWQVDNVIHVRTAPPECSQFVLGMDGLIQSHKLATTQHWLFQDVDLKGRSLRMLLTEVRPDWEACLPVCLGDSDTTLYLPEAIPGATGLVLAVHRMQHADLTFVSLTPELAPPEKLKEAGMADFQPNAATFAKLFLRLRSVESRLEHYLAHLPGVVFQQRADLSFGFVGRGCENLLGLPASTLARDSQALLKLIHPSDERNYYQELDRNIEAIQPFSLVYRVLNPQTNACIYLLDVRSPVRSESGLLLGYEGVWLDITRQKIAEHRLTTRAWKENLSTLTSGLLNDFGNAMTGIYSLSELYHNTLPPTHPLHDGLGLIKENAAQAQRMVGKIIELNRETSDDKTYANLGKIIRDQMDLLKIVLPRGTQLSGPQIDGDWPVYIDEIAFRQTLINLAMNSRDALKNTGEIRIFLRRIDPGEAPLVDTIPPLPISPQPMIELVFADNGRGISPAHLPRIFDPFFSTKHSNRGAGLGLYNARLFAEAHQGQIAARSSLDRGTEIVLLLPLADLSLLDPNQTHGSHPHPASAKPLRVLFLDLETTEEVPLVDTLRHRKWDVQTVSTAEHARRMLRQEGIRLGLLIIRVRENDSALRILIAEIRRDHPGLPVAVAFVRAGDANFSTTLATQVDLVLTGDIADRDAADSLAKLIRSP